MNAQIFRAKNLDEALNEASASLGISVAEMQYEVVEESSDGVVIEASPDAIAILGLFLSQLFEAGRLDLRVHLKMGEEALEGELSGEDFGLLAAGKGRGLDSLQYLCNRMLGRKIREHLPVRLDGGGFKDRRADRLYDEALDAAEDAVRRGRPVSIGPLTPAARREVHLALADDEDVYTESEGDGFLKRVVVHPQRR